MELLIGGLFFILFPVVLIPIILGFAERDADRDDGFNFRLATYAGIAIAAVELPAMLGTVCLLVYFLGGKLTWSF